MLIGFAGLSTILFLAALEDGKRFWMIDSHSLISLYSSLFGDSIEGRMYTIESQSACLFKLLFFGDYLTVFFFELLIISLPCSFLTDSSKKS